MRHLHHWLAAVFTCIACAACGDSGAPTDTSGQQQTGAEDLGGGKADDGSCRPVTCRMGCRNGWAKDESGCEICKCADAPAEPEEPATVECEPVTCRMYCRNGWAKDANGCDECRCADEPAQVECKPVTCRMYCRNGWAKDENGCDECRCAE